MPDGVELVATVRASDYFGPYGTANSPLGDLVIGAALSGRPARVVGDPDQPHSYTYTVDAARTLAVVGTRPDVADEVFHVPNAPALSTREIIGLIAELHQSQSGKPRATFSVAVNEGWGDKETTHFVNATALGLFNPTIRELHEMLYESTGPFIVDSTKARVRFGLEPTPIGRAFDETISWFRHPRSPTR